MKKMLFRDILAGMIEMGKFGDCAKQNVRCTIILADGTKLSACNWCSYPQQVCPREPGEGYEKCKTVCGQYGHAEQVVARYADEYDFTGATAILEGHTYYCMDCQHTLFDLGVVSLQRK